MGRILVTSSAHTRCLPPDFVVGRSGAVGLVVERDGVSRNHAQISWVEREWVIRDLNSTNGTFINGVRAAASKDIPLRADAVVGLGRREEDLRLVDASPPRAFASDGDLQVEEDEGGVIVLPEGRVRESASGVWELVTGRLSSQVGDRIGRWTLHKPTVARPTLRNERVFDQCILRFELHDKIDSVGLTLVFPTEVVVLGPAEVFFPLLMLARQRGGPRDGWVRVERLANLSLMARATLDVYLSRARTYVRLASVLGGERLYEVRAGERRLGVPPDRIREVRIG